MQPPSLYSHFDSKHAIYDAMFGQGWSAYLAACRKHFPRLPEPRARLRDRLPVLRLQRRRPCVVPAAEPARRAWLPAKRGLRPSLAVMELMRTELTEIGGHRRGGARRFVGVDRRGARGLPARQRPRRGALRTAPRQGRRDVRRSRRAADHDGLRHAHRRNSMGTTRTEDMDATSHRGPWVSAFDRDTAMRLAATEYDRLADLLAELTPEEWRTATGRPAGMCVRWRATAWGWRRWRRACRRPRGRWCPRCGPPSARQAQIDVLTGLQVREHAQLADGDLSMALRTTGRAAVAGRRRVPNPAPDDFHR